MAWHAVLRFEVHFANVHGTNTATPWTFTRLTESPAQQSGLLKGGRAATRRRTWFWDRSAIAAVLMPAGRPELPHTVTALALDSEKTSHCGPSCCMAHGHGESWKQKS